MSNLQSIVFATNNSHKLHEVRAMIGDRYNVLSLNDINCHDDIHETASTLEGNALLKARYVKEKYGYDCFADDTGLEVVALGGEPGVYSARYAGTGHDSEANMRLLLANLGDTTNRAARFRTVIALVMDNTELTVEGIVNGTIARQPSGYNGFGYDPVFVPEGYETTFAQMTDECKNLISHRRRAVEALMVKLSTLELNID